MKHTILILAIATLTVLAPMGLADGVAPTATINGGFELFIPPEAASNLDGTPADECIGIGHQVYYGTETYQHDLLEKDDPTVAADRDPVAQAQLLSGYDRCVWNEEEGYDGVAWVNLVDAAQKPAVAWSHEPEQSPTVFGDNDGDMDREATILADGSLKGHNMWQSYASAHEAFTGDFEAFELDVEAGELRDGGLVQISMSPAPLREVSDHVVSPDCRLNIHGSLMEANMVDGHVSVDPVDAQYVVPKGYEGCPTVDEWNAADDDGKRDILSQLKIVQMSFWGFNAGVPEDPDCGCAVQIDNVSISNPASLVEAALEDA